MKLVFTAAAAAALCVVEAHPAKAVSIHRSYAYYTIQGRTAEDLDRELRRRGPFLESDREHHAGAAMMRFDTSVKYGLVGGICRIVRADVTLNVTITLPRWDASRPPTDPYLAVVWDVLSKDIRRHEERHVAIADDHAKRLERGLRRLPPTKGCERLKRKVEETTQAELKKEEADQAGFDRSEQAGFNARFTRLVNQRLKALSRN